MGDSHWVALACVKSGIYLLGQRRALMIGTMTGYSVRSGSMHVGAQHARRQSLGWQACQSC